MVTYESKEANSITAGGQSSQDKATPAGTSANVGGGRLPHAKVKNGDRRSSDGRQLSAERNGRANGTCISPCDCKASRMLSASLLLAVRVTRTVPRLRVIGASASTITSFEGSTSPATVAIRFGRLTLPHPSQTKPNQSHHMFAHRQARQIHLLQRSTLCLDSGQVA